jgi:hypothetical protein
MILLAVVLVVLAAAKTALVEFHVMQLNNNTKGVVEIEVDFAAAPLGAARFIEVRVQRSLQDDTLCSW